MTNKKKSRNFFNKQTKGKTTLSFIFYSLAKGIALAPRVIRQCLVILIFGLLFILPNPYRKRIRLSINTFFPKLNLWQKELLVHRNMFQSLSTLFDILAMWFHGKDWTAARIKKVHNEDIIDESLKNNRNVIFVSYHFGNWEVLAPYLTNKFQCYNIYKAASNSYLNETIQKFRTSCNIIGFEVDNRMLVKNIVRPLREGKKNGLMLLPDQRPQGNSSSVMANFYGLKTPFNLLSGKLIPLVNCDVILICGLSCGGGDYEIFMKKPPTGIYSSDPVVGIEAMNKGYEELINLDPSQYNWLQDKFKHFRRRQNRAK